LLNGQTDDDDMAIISELFLEAQNINGASGRNIDV
jgi:hypothetical protein